MSNIVIKKGIKNNLVVTLSERSRLINPYFLMIITSKFDNSITQVSVLNSAVSNPRYNILEIEEKTSPVNLNSEVELVTGEHDYRVYESVDQTLDVNQTTNRILQRGLIIVKI